jgi:hypothetical protein
VNKNIEEALEEIKADCRGRYRFRLSFAGLSFYSEPVPRDRFLMEYAKISGHDDFTGVQYESKSEYTPGNYIWQTF